MAKKSKAYTIIELIVIVVIATVVILAVIAVSKVSQNSAASKTVACQANVATMNTQIEAYHVERGSWPSLLTDITNDANYFPKGSLVCPSGGTYSMSDTTHRVSCDAPGH
ncbi:MAG: hypothetical protein WC476_06810 [Phycisphaerae bacterium]|jgi:competence protein ComGC